MKEQSSRGIVMEVRKSRTGWQTHAGVDVVVSVFSFVWACASGGGATPASTPSTSSTTTSTPAPPVSVSPVADGDIEHTQFSPSLDVNLAKMMRRNSGLYVQDLTVGTGSVAAQG